MPKLLLKVDVDKLGHVGDLVDVADGYARNYLLPHGLAVAPTPANVKLVEQARKQAEARRIAEQKERKALADKLNGTEVTIVAKANEQGHLFGSVTQKHIAEALKEEGYNIHVDYIKLPEHLKQVDKYEVMVNFGNDITSTVIVWVAPERDAEGNLVVPEAVAEAEIEEDEDYDYDDLQRRHEGERDA